MAVVVDVLKKDMQDLGFIFEYCDYYCKSVYQKDIDTAKFLTAFMKSGVRYGMEACQPLHLDSNGYEAMRMFIDNVYDRDLSPFAYDKYEAHDGFRFSKPQLNWAGSMYAFLHYNTKKSSKRLVDTYPVEDMLNSYPKYKDLPMERVLIKLEIKNSGKENI